MLAGKTTALAALMGDEGTIIALDRSHAKAQEIRQAAHQLVLCQSCTSGTFTCMRGLDQSRQHQAVCRTVWGQPYAASPIHAQLHRLTCMLSLTVLASAGLQQVNQGVTPCTSLSSPGDSMFSPCCCPLSLEAPALQGLGS